MVRLRLLGALALTHGDGASIRSVLAQPKRFALLAYLATPHPPRDRRRDTLLGLFWAERDEAHARTNLRQTLYQLRRSLGAGVITGKGDELVGVDPSRLWTDAAAFAAAVEEGRDEEALELYGGPFLEGFHISEAPGFERWVERERRRLRRFAVQAAWRLAERSEREGNRPASARWAERALELAPYDEECLRRYLELMAELGQPAAVVRAYEAYAARLAGDLHLEPSAETAALVQRIRGSTAAEGAVDGPDPDSSPPASEASTPRSSGTAPADTTLAATERAGDAETRERAGEAVEPERSTGGEVLADLWSKRAERPRRTRALVGVLAVALAAAGGFAVWTAWAASGPGVDPQVVAVLPFRVAGAEPSLGHLREGMVDLLAARLSGDAGPRAVDPQTLIRAWRAAGAGETDLTREEALGVARELGAGRLVRGEIVSLPGRVVLTASVHDVGSLRAEPPIEVKGPVDSLPSLVDRLTAGLLSVEAGEGRRLASLMTSSPAALRLYLEGQAAYRDGRQDEAVSSFARAVELDSTFALAALMTWRAAVMVRMPAPVGLLEAWRHRERLGERDRAFLQAVVGPDYPGHSSYSDLLAGRRSLVRLQPDNAEAWFSYGEAIPGAGVVFGEPDSAVFGRAVEAFERAVALDSAFLPALERLWFTARLLGDTAGARRYGDLFLARSPGGLQAETIRCLRARGFPGVEALPEIAARIDSVGGVLPARCLWWLHFIPEASALRDSLTEHLKREYHDPRSLLFTSGIFHMVLQDMGRPGEAARYADALFRSGYGDSLLHLTWRVRDGLYWDADDVSTEAAAVALEERLARYPPESSGGSAARALCTLGQWRVARRRAGDAVEIVRTLRTLGATGESAAEVEALLCAQLLETWQAVRAGAPDAAERIARLDSARVRGPLNGWLLHETNLATARLLEETGDQEGALRALRRAGMIGPPAYRSTIFRESGRLAALLGDTAAAVDAYRRYLAMRTHPEPALRPQVRRIAAEFERLRPP